MDYLDYTEINDKSPVKKEKNYLIYCSKVYVTLNNLSDSCSFVIVLFKSSDKTVSCSAGEVCSCNCVNIFR